MNVLVYAYFSFLISVGLCMYSTWASGLLGYFALGILILLVWLWTVLTLNDIIQYCKSYFFLSCVNPKPFWSVTYSSWPSPCLTFCGAWAAFHDYVCGYVISNDMVQLAIRHTNPGVSVLSVLDESNIIIFLSSVTVLYASVSPLYMGEIFCHAQIVLSPWKCALIGQFPI